MISSCRRRACPRTTTRLSWTVISPASRSTADHLRPQIWPRRIPVVSSSRKSAANRSRCTDSRNFWISLGSHTVRRLRGRLGGLMLLAGLYAMYFQVTASTRARWIIAWMLRTVLGARPGESAVGTIPDWYRRSAVRAAWIVVPHASETSRGFGFSPFATRADQ